MSGATISLLQSQSIQALANTINIADLVIDLKSSTKLVVKDPTTGIKLVFTGAGLAGGYIGSYFILSEGQVTGIDLSVNGVDVATGSGYTTFTATLILAAITGSLAVHNATPLLDLWFGEQQTLSGSAAAVKTNVAFLSQYSKIVEVDIVGDPLVVSVQKFDANQAFLDKVTGGFEISDTKADVKGSLAALESDHAHINSISLSDGATSMLRLTQAQATQFVDALALISSPEILAVQSINNAWTTVGHGDHLQISDIAGVDTITGGGAHEHFNFGADFGSATITDFYQHQTATDHDTIVLAASEFVNGAQTLLSDLHSNGANVDIVAGADVLTIDNITRHDFKAALTAGYVKFV